ncbi:LOW QUALITY PROTEIN: membrane-spanning 4-domains subfamily A member 14 [Manis pentadactyla]|uniref:LOW QUALITY PROTEIN: membrane-spanning 4-domains subfamily A member 14 n=1 Tax=Manis pentadactyla TaxID=143292 RepID=UPI00255D1319|nr:LOW QUALITY PROTEIN: membrane-spanning 4-domains subfamily A member 14 [Manis pentadactyla]
MPREPGTVHAPISLLTGHQILLALVTVGIGTIFAFNSFHFSQGFPLVFLTIYLLWEAFIGILSVSLIISIAELSISVTIASFRSQHWTRSNEIVFFSPLNVTQDSELSVPEENAIIQFELQEEFSSDDSTGNTQPVFLGVYTFFKLRVSRDPLAFQHSGRRGSVYYSSSLSVPDEQQKNIHPPLKLYKEQTEWKPLTPHKRKRPSENIIHSRQLNDEDLQYAIVQSPEIQTQLLQAQAISSPSIKNSNCYHPKTCNPTLCQPKFCQHAFPKYKFCQYKDPTFHAVQYPNIQCLHQQSPDLQLQNVQTQDQQFIHISYQNIQSEVMLLTQEWKCMKERQEGKSPKQHALDQQSKTDHPQKQLSISQKSKGCQSPKKKSLVQIQDQQSPRKKSLDPYIKGWLSPKRHSIDKRVYIKQTMQQPPYQQAEDQLAQGEQSPKEESKVKQDKDQQADKKQSPKKQTQHQQDQQLQDALFQDSRYQDDDQQDLQSTSTEKEDMQIDDMKTTGIKPGKSKYLQGSLSNFLFEIAYILAVLSCPYE